MKKYSFLFAMFMSIYFTGVVASNAVARPVSKDDTPPEIRIATTEVSHAVLSAADTWYKEKGLTIKLIMTAGNVNVLRAVDEGATEAAVGVHIKFMDNFNAKNHGTLTMVKPYPYTTGIGFYSEKYSSIEELPQGAKIAIMNDPMNMHRGLIIMQDAGLITLDKSHASSYSLLDITSNPKNISFLEMDQTQTVRVLPEVDGSIVFFTHMRNAGKDFRSYLLRDHDAKDFPMGVVVRAEDANKPWAIELANGLRSPQAREFIKNTYDNVFEYLDN